MIARSRTGRLLLVEAEPLAGRSVVAAATASSVADARSVPCAATDVADLDCEVLVGSTTPDMTVLVGPATVVDVPASVVVVTDNDVVDVDVAAPAAGAG